MKTLTYRPFAKLYDYRPMIKFPWGMVVYVSVNKKVGKCNYERL